MIPWRICTISALYALVACSPEAFRPTVKQVAAVEAALNAHPCVGDLSAWRRQYWIHPERANKIEFDLALADGKSVKSGRDAFATKRGEKVFMVEEAETKVAGGFYELAERRLSVEYCELNY